MPRHWQDGDDLETDKINGKPKEELVFLEGGKLVPPALKLQILVADPDPVEDGDLWLRDLGGGSFEIRAHVGGATKRVALIA